MKKIRYLDLDKRKVKYENRTLNIEYKNDIERTNNNIT